MLRRLIHLPLPPSPRELRRHALGAREVPAKQGRVRPRRNFPGTADVARSGRRCAKERRGHSGKPRRTGNKTVDPGGFPDRLRPAKPGPWRRRAGAGGSASRARCASDRRSVLVAVRIFTLTRDPESSSGHVVHTVQSEHCECLGEGWPGLSAAAARRRGASAHNARKAARVTPPPARAQREGVRST